MRIRRSAVFTLALALACAAALAACGGPTASGGEAQSPTPAKGGTLVVTFQAEPTELDPAIAWDVESWSIERLTYQTFLTYRSDPGAAGTQLVPDLAIEVPTAANGGISADGTVYTFKLRRGVKFAPPVDREVEAADFKYSFERMMKDPLAPGTFLYHDIVGAEDFLDGATQHIKGYSVVDDSTVQISLTQPRGDFLNALSMPFTSVLPKEWVKKVGKQITRRPLGTGPYIIRKWAPGQQIVAEKNPNWSQEGRQWVDSMVFELSVSPSAALHKLQTGEADVLGDPVPASDYEHLKDDPRWSANVVEAPQIAWYYVFMNVLEKPFDDARVRQAVNYAVDTGRTSRLLAGRGAALDQIYPYNMPGHQADREFYTYDPEKAKQLLLAAGYPTGFATTLYGHNVEPFPELAKAIQSDLGAVGIQCDLKLMDRATYWDFVSRRDSEVGIGLSDWYMDFPDPSDWIGPLFTDPIDGGADFSFYDNPEVDRLYSESHAEADPARRLELFVRMQDIIMRDAPTAPLFQPLWNGMYGSQTGGYYIHPVWIFDFPEYWKAGGR